ncbi:alpha/beta hydrolase [Synechococcus elongatus]|uniref:alpha/beta hydrolase n=1 Tax=Synechococcus elongatus TaxID=32046 RepID=UPI000F7F2E8D|nr:alpha/beta hydrolase [Synechococcus elongatus]
MFKPQSWFPTLLSTVLGFGAAVLTAAPSSAAERITVRWSGTDVTIAVDDLANFAQGRPVGADLRAVLALLSPEVQQSIRSALIVPVPISPNAIQQIVNRGDTFSIFLTRVGNVIRAEPPVSLTDPAIATAITTAAQSPQGLSFLSAIQTFPSETILFDLNVFLSYIQQLNEQLLATEGVVNRLQQRSQPADPALQQRYQAPGPNSVQVQSFNWQDPQRNRPVPTDLYLPSGTSRNLPLVVVSHGLGETRQTFAYLARHLASHGYAVALPEHVTTSARSFENVLVGISSPPGPQALIDIPTDIRFVLDQLAATPAAARVQTQKAAVVGHSYGGYGALAVAGAPLSPVNARQQCEPLDRFRNNLSTLLQCIAINLPQPSYTLTDPRIVAAVAADGLASDVFGAAGLSQVTVPTLIWGGSRDVVTPPQPEAIAAFQQLGTRQKWLALAVKGTHFTVLPPNNQQPQGFQIPLPPELIGPSQAAGNLLFQGLTLAFLDQTFRGQPATLLPSTGTTTIATPELTVLVTPQSP